MRDPFRYFFKTSKNYDTGPAAYPRTPSLVFQPPTTLPVFRLTGAGTPVQIGIRPLAPPQVHYAQTWPLVGYGGVSAGMIYGYPLAANGLGQPLGTAPVS